jgi:competence protein ComEC
VEQTAISVTAHTEVTVNGTAATCTENGLSDGKKCSVCGTVTVVQVTVTATGHNWQAATTEAPKTCLTCGLTEGDKLPSESGVTYSTLNISYINVGQGDSILIKVDDCDILIDGGKSGAGSTVTSYLNSKGVDDIELMINTHPDEDHYGGLTTVLKSFKVEDFWGSSYSKSTSTYTTFKSQLSSEGLSLYTPSVNAVYTYENLTLTVLYAGAGASSSNDSSLVIMLEYGSFRFLFTGDISSTIESKLIGKDLSCDVLKVPHHGSSGSSSASFLSATGADYAVICVGSNSYGHPTTEALNRLSSAGMTVYRTDNNGNVVFSTNGSTLTIPGGSTVGGGSGSGSSGSGSSDSGSSGSGDSGSTSTEYFIGNTESKVFHLPTCSNLPAASKQNVMYDYDWIINIAGYTPCGRCLKNYSGGTTVQYIANKNTKVYHVSTCSYLPSSANRITIYDTTGYTPCSRCIGKSAAASYTLPVTTYQIYAHVNIPAMPKKAIAYCEYGYECA